MKIALSFYSPRVLLPLLEGLLIGCGAIEEFFIFHPGRTVHGTPSALGLRFEDVRFPAADGTELHGWFVPAREGAASATLVWFHGNAGNISDRLENLKIFHDSLEVHIFLFDYRGFGNSDGKISEKGTYQDAEGAWTYLQSRSDVDPKKMVFFGRSLGASVAVELALRYPPAGLILESPFLSVPAMARSIIPLPLGRLFKTRYDSLAKIPQVRVPLLVLHGDQDTIVPLSQGKALFKAANEPKSFYLIAGADHNDTYLVGGAPYLKALAEFLKEIARGPKG